MKEKKVVLVLGQRGTGKSYAARKLAEGMKRLIIYDTLGEYDGEGVSCESLDEFKKYFLSVYKDNFRIVYQPSNPGSDEGRQEFNEICGYLYDCGDLVLMVEEIDTFCPGNSMLDQLANIIQRGRHKNISFIGVSQRPVGIPKIITSQAKTIYTFLHREPRDIEYLRDFIGQEAEQISDLGQYEYLKWDNGKITKGKM